MITVNKLAPEITEVRLSRPGQLNALTDKMVSDLQSALIAIGNDPRCRVVMLTGAGRGFCAGLDLKANIEAYGHDRSDADAAIRLQEHYAAIVRMLRALRQPVIAAVNGAAVGAGMGLSLAADIRLAGHGASFHIGAIKVALSAGECGISYHLPRLVGAGRAFELMLTGRPVHAEEALQIGLVTEVVDDEMLGDAALRTAESILRNAPFAVEQTKKLMWANLHSTSLDSALELENRTQILAMLRPDFASAVDTFVKK